jgi:Polyketide cyclase / dehydrase and lipid transport
MGRRIFVATLCVVLSGTLCPASKPFDSVDSQDGWKLAAESNAVTIYSRLRADSPIKEFKAIGEIDAPTRIVHAVIDDLESYPNFMPVTAECRILKRENDSIITYQRLSPGICSDRDYTLRARTKSWRVLNGLAYLHQWETANDIGPPEKKGIVRVTICKGSWLFEPNGTERTRATYSVYADTGGAIPVFLANRVSQMEIGRLFVAVRKQTKDPKYR